MWNYEKRLIMPVNVSKKDLHFVKVLITQYGGPFGELDAALRYLNQRYTMPTAEGKALLTDIGTEELGHVEMICAMCYQMCEGATIDEIKAAGLEGNYSEHGLNFFPTDASGVPMSAKSFAVTGDPIADLNEDLAAEAKAKVTYEHLMKLSDDDEVIAILSFLREREIVHYQRFGELLNKYYELEKEGKL